ncbi:hypothetical protein CERSUDRAFT_101715 [Gelatoporia subvermispora B]|uniref:Uncharacterized protein n=1 Tax=Ceriporiopsis subvermispora (strain B) TaxID=914234 RepID=M2QUR4_CERS8|nr:hypothetical protein CERSUDRAFT_101715 [Gelatoporia subvermispora B]
MVLQGLANNMPGHVALPLASAALSGRAAGKQIVPRSFELRQLRCVYFSRRGTPPL